MRRASGSAIPLRSTSSSILTLRQAPTQWPQYTCPPDFLRGYVFLKFVIHELLRYYCKMLSNKSAPL